MDVDFNLIGLAAGICTTISFIPQIRKIVVTKQTRDISLGMYLVFTLGVVLWFIYGLFLASYPVIIANLVTLIFCFIIITAKLKNGGKTR